ncbi:MAG: hypothetical protein L0228_07240 [Planctomycetes bacterium]|nr:hypothetical protein [Planctomycetota bacterium]
MSDHEPLVTVPTPVRNLCPICGKASYSLGGIHPQCAMQQADAPRELQLRAAKKAEVAKAKPRQRSWKKKCPKCGTDVHARREACKCGFKFGGR